MDDGGVCVGRKFSSTKFYCASYRGRLSQPDGIVSFRYVAKDRFGLVCPVPGLTSPSVNSLSHRSYCCYYFRLRSMPSVNKLFFANLAEENPCMTESLQCVNTKSRTKQATNRNFVAGWTIGCWHGLHHRHLAPIEKAILPRGVKIADGERLDAGNENYVERIMWLLLAFDHSH